jgi:hypothetical protein
VDASPVDHMAIRMPSQKKLLYYDTAEGGVSNDAWTSVPSGGTGAGHTNLVKDLSLLNRYGLDHTTRDGTPLVYRVRVTLHGQTFAGTGAAVSGFAGDDSFTTIKVDGCQNTWVMKEAAKKFHQAREKMFADAGVTKSSRGKYSHTIRYNYNGASDTWLTPIDGNGAALNGGTWDVSALSYGSDNEFQLGLVASGDDEESNAFAGTYLSIGHAYLLSRANMPADTNPQTEEGPAQYSVLKRMLQPDEDDAAGQAYVTHRARGEQDNPPYEVLDISDSGDVDHDVTEPVELGRMTVGGGDGYVSSMVIDVPFGIMDVRLHHYSQADENEVFNPVWGVELLKISEMTG